MPNIEQLANAVGAAGLLFTASGVFTGQQIGADLGLAVERNCAYILGIGHEKESTEPVRVFGDLQARKADYSKHALRHSADGAHRKTILHAPDAPKTTVSRLWAPHG